LATTAAVGLVTGALGAALQDTDPEVRASAALALGWQNNLEGVASLVAALRDPDWRVVDSAVKALGEIGVSATGRLLGVLRDPAQDVTLRYQVARALAAMGRPAVNELVVALSEQNPDVQKWSAVALAEIGIAAPDVIGALEKLEQNSSGDLRWVASEQLRRLRRTTG
jgi:HEAT repeat protein